MVGEEDRPGASCVPQHGPQHDAQKAAKTSSESFSDRAVKGQISDADAEKQSRDFQEAIFHRRSSSPLLLRGVYWIHRSALEEQMNVAAEAMVAEYAAIKA